MTNSKFETTQGYLTGLDKKQIFYRAWLVKENCKGLVAIIHGIGEHSSRYENVARIFNENNFSVISMDLRGHGKTKGTRGHIKNIETILDDITLLLKKGQELVPSLPCFLYGHSMGGNIVIKYGLKPSYNLNGIISTSPWLILTKKINKTSLIFINLFSYILPYFTVNNGLKSKDILGDTGSVKQYSKDELNHKRISLRTLADLDQSSKWIMKNSQNLKLPILLVHGLNDVITSHIGTATFAESVPDFATLKLWEGLYHETHNEINAQEVIPYTIAWINKFLI